LARSSATMALMFLLIETRSDIARRNTSTVFDFRLGKFGVKTIRPVRRSQFG